MASSDRLPWHARPAGLLVALACAVRPAPAAAQPGVPLPPMGQQGAPDSTWVVELSGAGQMLLAVGRSHTGARERAFVCSSLSASHRILQRRDHLVKKHSVASAPCYSAAAWSDGSLPSPTT